MAKIIDLTNGGSQDMHLSRIGLGRTKGKAAVHADLLLELEVRGDEPVELAGPLAIVRTALLEAQNGGPSSKFQIEPGVEGKLTLSTMVDGEPDETPAIDGFPAVLRRLLVAAVNRRARVVAVFRVSFADPQDAALVIEALASDVRVTFAPAQAQLFPEPKAQAAQDGDELPPEVDEEPLEDAVQDVSTHAGRVLRKRKPAAQQELA
jgi:hypothetical protein